MSTIRVSVTSLEAFRLFLEPDQAWMTEPMLIAGILRQQAETPRMSLGTAFGEVLADPVTFASDDPPGYVHGDYFWTRETMREPLALMDHEHGCFELKASKRYHDLTVVAKADHVAGLRVVENKTTDASFDYMKYQSSVQWKFMADLFAPVSVTYHIFRLTEDADAQEDYFEDTTANRLSTFMQAYRVREINSFTVYPYAGLHAECADLALHFQEFLITRGLDGALRRRQRDAEVGRW